MFTGGGAGLTPPHPPARTPRCGWDNGEVGGGCGPRNNEVYDGVENEARQIKGMKETCKTLANSPNDFTHYVFQGGAKINK